MYLQARPCDKETLTPTVLPVSGKYGKWPAGLETLESEAGTSTLAWSLLIITGRSLCSRLTVIPFFSEYRFWALRGLREMGVW